MEQISDGESEWESSLVGKKKEEKMQDQGFSASSTKCFSFKWKKD